MKLCTFSQVFSYIGFVLVSSYFICGLVTADCGADCNESQSWGEWVKDYVRAWKIPNFGINLAPDSDDGTPVVVKFMLYNRNNLDNPEEFTFDNPDGIFKQFDVNKPTKILVHGWMGSFVSKFSVAMVHAYLPTFDYNIVLVDWGDKAKKFYPVARQVVPLIGKYLADFIDLLCKTYNIKPESLHVVGHSLGAHISGVAGRFIQTGTLGRISGLDPALPFFADDHNDKLTIKAAHFVDVIHTCGRYLGWFNHIGHADFYPNKGVAVQPGCGLDVIGKCSHRRAWEYFAESISKPNLFMAIPCPSWHTFEKGTCKGEAVSMGEYLPTNTRGVFYLMTNKAEPYARGMEGLKFK